MAPRGSGAAAPYGALRAIDSSARPRLVADLRSAPSSAASHPALVATQRDIDKADGLATWLLQLRPTLSIVWCRSLRDDPSVTNCNSPMQHWTSHVICLPCYRLTRFRTDNNARARRIGPTSRSTIRSTSPAQLTWSVSALLLLGIETVPWAV
jgi:hypothetical protein